MIRQTPSLSKLLRLALNSEQRPSAFVLAGHNGSGKSTLWYQRLADQLKLPLVNADRLTLSILPEADDARDPQYRVEAGLRSVSDPWLEKVVGPFEPARPIRGRARQS